MNGVGEQMDGAGARMSGADERVDGAGAGADGAGSRAERAGAAVDRAGAGVVAGDAPRIKPGIAPSKVPSMTPGIAPEFAARVLRHEPLSKHTSWHAGGPAELFFTPRDAADLAEFLKQLPTDVPLLVIGLGSNLLVRDGGVRGVVVSLHGALGKLERRGAAEVYAEAGVPCARIARQCIKWGLGAADFFAGIPGTLGGALAMNAGAWGGETWRQVIDVDVVDRGGACHVRPASEYAIGYREVRGPRNEWFVAARLKFPPAPGATDAVMRELLEKRRLTQPIGEWSCGSVFTNPPGGYAAQLIESAGLKGFCVGDAMVSEKHANFIVNRGQARAADIEAVIRHVQRTVAEVHGTLLTTEVRIVGDPS
jgi:UDP-N-acetylmuramate dehydrogenase